MKLVRRVDLNEIEEEDRERNKKGNGRKSGERKSGVEWDNECGVVGKEIKGQIEMERGEERRGRMKGEIMGMMEERTISLSIQISEPRHIYVCLKSADILIPFKSYNGMHFKTTVKLRESTGQQFFSCHFLLRT